MKILATSDLHQSPDKWKRLVKACQKEKFDIVAIAGDLFPKDRDIIAQHTFLPNIQKYCKKINDTNAKIILTLGNDDNRLLIDDMIKLNDENSICYLNNTPIEIMGWEFAGMPYVPDYPFQYKFWCRAETEDNLRIDIKQFGKPLTINHYNEIKTIDNYPYYLKHQKSIKQCLNDLKSQIKNINKSIWLIHAPPARLDLDVCATGAKVGSESVYEFVNENQPFLTIHGHIHESPLYNGGIWFKKVGETYCLQSGQWGFELAYSSIEIKDDHIINMSHSILGDQLWKAVPYR